jgi:Zn finger protein HypA/HybF involved in hydrogenase expression
MKLRYELTFKCNHCGSFIKKNAQDIVESTDCPRCHRLSEFVEGTVRRIPELKRVITKSQKKLEIEAG